LSESNVNAILDCIGNLPNLESLRLYLENPSLISGDITSIKKLKYILFYDSNIPIKHIKAFKRKLKGVLIHDCINRC